MYSRNANLTASTKLTAPPLLLKHMRSMGDLSSLNWGIWHGDSGESLRRALAGCCYHTQRTGLRSSTCGQVGPWQLSPDDELGVLLSPFRIPPIATSMGNALERLIMFIDVKAV
jgi:hypothetical protein